jgi:hypothetical protein
LYDLLRPYLTHLFVKGGEVPLYKDTTFWPRIKGNWYYNHNLKPDRLVFERSKEGKDLSFTSDKAYLDKIISKRLGFNKTDNLTTKWDQKEDVLEFALNEQIVRLRVLRLDEFYLILQPDK